MLRYEFDRLQLMTTVKHDFPLKAGECKNCGVTMDMYSNNQKYCQPEDNPECYDNRVTKNMSDRQYAKYRSIPYNDYKLILTNQ